MIINIYLSVSYVSLILTILGCEINLIIWISSLKNSFSLSVRPGLWIYLTA
jgi:hypothetical protein